MAIPGKASGELITAAHYNAMQEKINSILGAGGGIYGQDYGYGQSVASSQVIPPTGVNNNTGDIITKKQMDDLRLDMLKCWQHQTDDPFPLDPVGDDSTISAE